jgi:hypothetical protein
VGRRGVGFAFDLWGQVARWVGDSKPFCKSGLRTDRITDLFCLPAKNLTSLLSACPLFCNLSFMR